MEITKDIKYIGVDDTDLDLFESQYIIPNGISYNSYLIVDEKIAIMDTVDKRKGNEWLHNLKQALGVRTPDYLVLHHLEPDHASLVKEILLLYPNIQILTSAIASKMLSQFFEDVDFTSYVKVIKENDEISLGTHTLKFFGAPMVHRPEVMVSYDTKDKILFSADAFGKFGALSANEDWACEARRYYFNICGKYGVQVQALIKKASALDIAIICPLHGPVLKENLSYYVGLYDTWSKYDVETEGIFIAYASIYGGTAEAALKLADILREKGCPKVATSDLTREDMAEAIEDAFRYGKIVVASSTYDSGIFTPMHNFLHHLQVKNYQKRKVGIIENGSWAPVAGKLMAAMFEQMKDIEIVQPMVTIKSRMKQNDIAQLQALADEMMK